MKDFDLIRPQCDRRIHDRWEKLKVRLREAKQGGGGRHDQVMLTTINAVQEMMDEIEEEEKG